ncbi:dihydrolipoyl dehydrogenase [Oxyplasma meridianum]|uniref:Dihydrolipoyl dehydrogenase n=1 Tax=Oxyplasma meridianum TaxID=3073602 RepID=A0AAX4NIT5_9ARCH
MRYDAAIIGSGPGGYAAAIRLGQHGRKVLLIEKDRIGGECLNYGCIPSKALIELANSMHYLKGMPGANPSFNLNLKEWQTWKWTMINRLTSGVETLCKSYGVEIVKGTGLILDEHHLSVSEATYEFENLIVATGSSPVKINGIDSPLYNREILDLQEVPRRLVIIGGGYIGIELGMAFAKLGSQVTVVEMLDKILTGADPDLVRPIERRLKELNVGILTSNRVRKVEKSGEYSVELENGEILKADQVLLTVGRRPNVTGFGLERLNLQMDGPFIKTDRHMRTSLPNVYAIGDVAGQPMLAHKAYYDAEVASDNICGMDSVVDYRAMPFVIYTDPEVAYTGKKSVSESSFPTAANGRSLTMNNTLGSVHIYADSKGIVTGGAVVAPHASELISEISLAVESGLMAMDIGLTIHPHPTVSEGVKEAAEMIYGKPLHFKPRD